MQGEGEEDVSMDELASNLSTCREQLILVRQQLKDDPRNAELADMETELSEVISLTEELLSTSKHADSSGLHLTDFTSTSEEHEFSVGDKIQAVYSEDGEWYECSVESLTPIGYIVRYNGWENSEEVDHANVRAGAPSNSLVAAERAAEATKEHIKRKIAEAAVSDYQSKVLPAKLKIAPDDPEEVKAAKRKKIHAFKSKARFEQLEVTQNKRQNAWQQFQTTKGKTKKIGFFSGRKRESIFKSPDDPNGRVGVTGSGKGLTDFQKREKHLHLKGGTIEADD